MHDNFQLNLVFVAELTQIRGYLRQTCQLSSRFYEPDFCPQRNKMRLQENKISLYITKIVCLLFQRLLFFQGIFKFLKLIGLKDPR